MTIGDDFRKSFDADGQFVAGWGQGGCVGGTSWLDQGIIARLRQWDIRTWYAPR